VNRNVTLPLPPTKNPTTTTPDPRSYLSLSDLKKMCEDRGLDLPRAQNKDSLVQALRDADDEFSVADLKKMCRSKGLNVGGASKVQMKYLLALAAARGRGSFEKGVKKAEEGEEVVDGMDMDVNDE
jgi:hypothetical protein